MQTPKAVKRRWQALALTIATLACGLGLAWTGIDRGLPEAPWGDEAWRMRVLANDALALVALPWQSPPAHALSPAQWARWTAPVLALGLIGLWAAPRWRRLWRRWRIRRNGGHIIVLGLDALSAGLVGRWLREGRAVLVVEPHAQQRQAAARLGAATQNSALDDAAVFAHCALARAESVVIVAGDDAARLGRALRCAELAASLRSAMRPALQLLVHVEDPLLRATFESRLLQASATSAIEARVFSAAQTAARGLLRQSPWRLHRASLHTTGPGLIVGTTPWAEAVLLQALRCDVQAEDERPEWVVVGSDATAFVQRLEGRWPGLHAVAQLHAIDQQPELARQVLAQLDALHLAPVAWCFCLADDLHNLGTAGAWYDDWHALARDATPRAVQAVRAPMMALRLNQPDAAQLPQDIWPDAQWRVFGSVAELVDESGVGEHLDALARGVHEGYLQAAEAHGETLGSRVALQRWCALPEHLRDDNRTVADHQFVKLHAQHIVAIAGEIASTAAPALEWSPTELEGLSRMEHARWVRQRLLAGWQWAAQRNDSLKQHPSLLPYGALSEPVKQLDRDQVLQLPALLQRCGLAAFRQRVAVVAGQPSPWAFADGLDQALEQWLTACFDAVPFEAGLLWMATDSALAWRAAELCLRGRHAQVALLHAETLPALLARQPSDAVRERVRLVARQAVESAWTSDGPAAVDQLPALVSGLKADSGLCIHVGTPAPGLVSQPGIAVLDADGRWLQTPVLQMGVTA